MAISVRDKHRDSGLSKTGHVGSSWTTMQFRALPALMTLSLTACAGDMIVKDAYVTPAHRCSLEQPSGAITSAAFGSTAMMTVSSRGGWCSVSNFYFDQVAMVPVRYSSVTQSVSPEHGKIQARQGNITFIDYLPNPGYVGSDFFAYRLQPANGYNRVLVQVVP